MFRQLTVCPYAAALGHPRTWKCDKLHWQNAFLFVLISASASLRAGPARWNAPPLRRRVGFLTVAFIRPALPVGSHAATTRLVGTWKGGVCKSIHKSAINWEVLRKETMWETAAVKDWEDLDLRLSKYSLSLVGSLRKRLWIRSSAPSIKIARQWRCSVAVKVQYRIAQTRKTHRLQARSSAATIPPISAMQAHQAI